MKRGLFLLLIICTLCLSCAYDPMQSFKPTATSPKKSSKAFPLKIGLLADSQLTSQNGFSDFHYRSKSADNLVDVSIRPPALECFLSAKMLDIAVSKLTLDSLGDKTGVDVILYLGDAANSGGNDEIDKALEILANHRQQTGVPIFIVIGNHDYLGAGNIVSPGIRFALLNRIGQPDNPPLTKYEVLKKFSAFNHENNALPSNHYFTYRDNAGTLEQNKNLDHKTGLYLSGVVTYAEPGKASVEIFLLDTSDYKDAPDWSEVADIGFYGVIGSVSFNDEPGYVSQLSYLKEFAKASSPDFRILASHYPKDHLDRITFAKPGQVPLDVTNLAWSVTENAFSLPAFTKTLNQSLEKLLTSDGENYWLSGHTHVHTIPRPDRFIVGGLVGEKFYRAVNIGSTTDYRAQAAVFERFHQQDDRDLDDITGYREIPVFDCDQKLLTAIVEALGTYGQQHADDPVFLALIPTPDEWNQETHVESLLGIGASLVEGFRKKDSISEQEQYWIDAGATLIGINKRYREENWTITQTDASKVHLQKFIDEFVDRTERNQDTVIACLGFLAGSYESELLTAKSNFSPDKLNQLCIEPK